MGFPRGIKNQLSGEGLSAVASYDDSATALSSYFTNAMFVT